MLRIRMAFLEERPWTGRRFGAACKLFGFSDKEDLPFENEFA
jgi:hypothetical protein